MVTCRPLCRTHRSILTSLLIRVKSLNWRPSHSQVFVCLLYTSCDTCSKTLLSITIFARTSITGLLMFCRFYITHSTPFVSYSPSSFFQASRKRNKLAVSKMLSRSVTFIRRKTLRVVGPCSHNPVSYTHLIDVRGVLNLFHMYNAPFI